MATGFAVDPQSYVPSVVARNRRYGPDGAHLYNYYPNAVRLAGGNPWIAYLHQGGWTDIDKTSDLETQTPLYFLAYFGNSGVYGTSAPPFDFFSVKTRQHSAGLSAFGNAAAVAVEPVYGTGGGIGVGGCGVTSRPGYNATPLDDYQRFIQFIKSYPSIVVGGTAYSLDPAKAIGMGASAGSNIAALCAVAPTRAYTTPTHATGPWDVLADSSLRGVLGLYTTGVDMSPWVTHYDVTKGALGLVESTTANVRADMDRALLVANAAGAYPVTSLPSALCKKISPVHRIAASYPENRGAKFRTYYELSATTPTPLTGYSTVPPHGPHDYHYFRILNQALIDAGMATAAQEARGDLGAVLDVNAFGGDGGLMWESTLPSTYAWAAGLVNF